MLNKYTVVTQDFVSVTVTNSRDKNQFGIERRFQKDITIENLKGKLEMLTGGNQATMKLELYNKDDKLICCLDDNNAMLGSYPIDDGMRIHVVDKFLLRNEMEDTKNIPKFELSQEEYTKRPDTLKSFLAQNKLGKYNEEEMKKIEEERQKQEAAEEALAQKIHIGDRCEVRVPVQPTRRGTVKFVGKVEFKSGWWVGVQYDEPLGKNDGSVQGKRYFECPAKYGGFVEPKYVAVGDYPEIQPDFDEEI